MTVALAPTTCKTGKVSYTTQREAEQTRQAICERMDTAASTKPRPVRPYQCNHCGQWHLTSKALRRPQYLADQPWGPITPGRRALWAAMEAERTRANLASPWPWTSSTSRRSAAA